MTPEIFPVRQSPSNSAAKSTVPPTTPITQSVKEYRPDSADEEFYSYILNAHFWPVADLAGNEKCHNSLKTQSKIKPFGGDLGGIVPHLRAKNYAKLLEGFRDIGGER